MSNPVLEGRRWAGFSVLPGRRHWCHICAWWDRKPGSPTAHPCLFISPPPNRGHPHHFISYKQLKQCAKNKWQHKSPDVKTVLDRNWKHGSGCPIDEICFQSMFMCVAVYLYVIHRTVGEKGEEWNFRNTRSWSSCRTSARAGGPVSVYDGLLSFDSFNGCYKLNTGNSCLNVGSFKEKLLRKAEQPTVTGVITMGGGGKNHRSVWPWWRTNPLWWVSQ